MTEKPTEIIEKAATSYVESTGIRAAVQAIPWVGGSLDTLLAGKGSKIQNERLQQFLSDLSNRLCRVETKPIISEEDLFNLAMDAISKAVTARSDEKRSLFARIMTKQIAAPLPYDQAEMALRVVSNLEIVHIQILREVLSAPIAGEGPFEGLRVVLVEPLRADDKGEAQGEPVLTERLNDYPPEVVRLAVAELISKGLIHDEGIGRWNGRAMERVVPTETAEWLLQWLA